VNDVQKVGFEITPKRIKG